LPDLAVGSRAGVVRRTLRLPLAESHVRLTGTEIHIADQDVAHRLRLVVGGRRQRERTTSSHPRQPGAPAAVAAGPRLHARAAERNRDGDARCGLPVDLDRPVALQDRMILKHRMEDGSAGRRRLLRAPVSEDAGRCERRGEGESNRTACRDRHVLFTDATRCRVRSGAERLDRSPSA
jgi:hypothetical protein